MCCPTVWNTVYHFIYVTKFLKVYALSYFQEFGQNREFCSLYFPALTGFISCVHAFKSFFVINIPYLACFSFLMI